MRAVVVLRDEIEPNFDAQEVHLLILENGTGRRFISSRGEMTSMARDKIRAIKKSERVVEKFEEFYNVSGLSIAFANAEEEIIHAVDSLKADVVYAFTKIPITERLLEKGAIIILPRGEFSLNRVLYIHFSEPNTEWLEKARELIIAAIVQPTMPPEASSRKFKEELERMEKETEELAERFGAKRIVIRGDIVNDTLRLSEEYEVDAIALSRGIGQDDIQRIAEKTGKTVIIL